MNFLRPGNSPIGIALAALVVLSGCTMNDLMPSLSGGPPSGKPHAPQAAKLPPNPPARTAQPPSGLQPAPPSAAPPAAGASSGPLVTLPGAPSTTYAGQRIAQLRAELVRLQGSVSTHGSELQQSRSDWAQAAQRYGQHQAQLNARLRGGTTPGNPELVKQWNEANTALDTLDATAARFYRVASAAATDASTARALLEQARATYGTPGASGGDQRQLAVLEEEISRTLAQTDRQSYQLNDELQRQNDYVAGERRNMQQFATAITTGAPPPPTYSSAPPVAAAPAMAAAPSMAPAPFPQPAAAQAAPARRPLVVIRFDSPNVAYEQQLYQAVNQALDRKADAMFDLVAVAPARSNGHYGGTAQQAAEGVLRSLTRMGMPANRITLSGMSSDLVQANEVHVFVR